MSGKLFTTVFSCFAFFAATMPAPGADAAAPSENSGVLDLFGQQDQTPKPSEKPVLESEQEIRRPETPARRTTAFAAEHKPIERTSKATAGWRLYDLIPIGVVLALIVVVALVIKRFMPVRSVLGGAGLEVLTRLNVSSKQSVAVIKVGKKLLVVGICPDRINTLSVIEDPIEVAEYLGEIASRQPSSITQAFKNSFDNEVDRYPELGEVDPEAAVRGQVRGLLEKVRSMKKSREVA